MQRPERETGASAGPRQRVRRAAAVVAGLAVLGVVPSGALARPPERRCARSHRAGSPSRRFPPATPSTSVSSSGTRSRCPPTPPTTRRWRSPSSGGTATTSRRSCCWGSATPGATRTPAPVPTRPRSSCKAPRLVARSPVTTRSRWARSRSAARRLRLRRRHLLRLHLRRLHLPASTSSAAAANPSVASAAVRHAATAADDPGPGADHGRARPAAGRTALRHAAVRHPGPAAVPARLRADHADRRL